MARTSHPGRPAGRARPPAACSPRRLRRRLVRRRPARPECAPLHRDQRPAGARERASTSSGAGLTSRTPRCRTQGDTARYLGDDAGLQGCIAAGQAGRTASTQPAASYTTQGLASSRKVDPAATATRLTLFVFFRTDHVRKRRQASRSVSTSQGTGVTSKLRLAQQPQRLACHVARPGGVMRTARCRVGLLALRHAAVDSRAASHADDSGLPWLWGDSTGVDSRLREVRGRDERLHRGALRPHLLDPAGVRHRRWGAVCGAGPLQHRGPRGQPVQRLRGQQPRAARLAGLPHRPGGPAPRRDHARGGAARLRTPGLAGVTARRATAQGPDAGQLRHELLHDQHPAHDADRHPDRSAGHDRGDADAVRAGTSTPVPPTAT